MDQVERNVLPSLNNLLENREMNLDDGRRLGSSELPVHPQFRVIALCLQTPPYGPGFPLDPPLRSRFQSRFIDELDTSSILMHLESFIESFQSETYKSRLQSLLTLYETLRSMRSIALHEGINLSTIPIFGIRQIKYCLSASLDLDSDQYIQRVTACIPSFTWMRSAAHPRLHDTMQSAWEAFINSSINNYRQGSKGKKDVVSNISFQLTTSQSLLFHCMTTDLQYSTRHIAILGSKSSGKSFLATKFTEWHALPSKTFPLYSGLTSRDLLQRRVTDEDGKTIWKDSVLVEAARKGVVCILDGINRVDSQSLVALQSLLQDGVVDLPNGERLIANRSFRCIALGEPMVKPGDHKWVSIDLNMSFYELKAMTSDDLIDCCPPSIKESNIHKVINTLYNELDQPEHIDVLPNLRHVLRLNRFFNGIDPTIQELKICLEGLLLLQYQSANVKQSFESVFQKLIMNEKLNVDDKQRSAIVPDPLIIDDGNSLKIGDLIAKRRIPSNPSYVPNPLFYTNSNHNYLLKTLLQAYVSGEKSFLLIGNQGDDFNIKII